MEFQPTRPLRGATDGTRHTVHSRRDISTHAPLAGRDYRLDGVEIACDISTHAPLAGRDAAMTLSIALMGNFNPRATCGARPADPGLSTKPVYFNPRATCGARPRSLITTIRMITNFNPRAPCGARPPARQNIPCPTRISTHAPLAGRDRIARTPSAGAGISTHAPLAGRDNTRSVFCRTLARFQPTRPLRGATETDICCRIRRRNFNPRAPCGARLCRGMGTGQPGGDFNPRAPCGARPGQMP